ncbi:MAG: DUF262 domain-containing protein [Firmicutes bacterium]|nr:DUF262 domain-containing protein [Bacillota bacterium]
MKSTATNRKLRNIFDGITSKKFILKPPFQRNLVWSKKHKNAIVRTVLEGYPFPEIYIATGELNLKTASGFDVLVDGQQRISSLYHYFTDSDEFEYEKDLIKYKDLTPTQQTDFLEYEVVIRDLGKVHDDEIIEVFKRINSTSYGLRKIEIENASYYAGEFMAFCDKLSENDFFEKHNIFSSTEIKRMRDVSFCATLVATLIGGYFDSEKRNEDFFKKYNDEFSEKDEINVNLKKVFEFINAMNLKTKRVEQKTDIFTLIIELYKIISNTKLNVNKVSKNLDCFYDAADKQSFADAATYYKHTLQGTNQRAARTRRAEIIKSVITGGIVVN